jgi:predicted nucleotidyltransferase
MSISQVLQSKRSQIIQIAARHGAQNVRVFGSVVRGDARPDSDIDFLVDMEGGRSLLDLVKLSQDLEELLHRKVDVLTDGGLSPHLEQHIHAEAVPL